MTDTTQARVRWFHITPGRFVLALLAVEVLLRLSERVGWLGWRRTWRQRAYGVSVLTAVAVVGVAIVPITALHWRSSPTTRKPTTTLAWP